MKQHPTAEEDKQLQAQLHEALAQCVVVGRAIKFESVTRSLFRMSDNMMKYEKFAASLRSFDLLIIVVDHIHAQLKSLDSKKLSDDPTLLKTIIGDTTLGSLEEKISAYLRSIPRAYMTYWALPNFESFGFGTVELSQDVALVEMSESFGLPIKKDTTTLAGLMGMVSLPGLPPPGGLGLTAGRVYLRVKAKGYTGSDLDAIATRSALARVKQAIAFGRCIGLFGVKYRSSVSECFVHSAADLNMEQQWPTLPAELSAYLASISLEKNSLQITLEGLLKLGALQEPERTKRNLSEKFKDATLVLDKPDGDPDATSIRTACEWSFDSHASKNQTLSFLQACIGLEAILGERTSPDEPLTNQLADRCAYLIGISIRERGELRKQFKQIYKVRSKIVHGRRPTLSPAEESHLNAAQYLLQRVIQRETLLMRAGEKKA